MKNLILIFTILLSFNYSAIAQYEFPFLNPDISMEKRVDDLVSCLILQEKIDQLLSDAPAIERLDIPKYNWWNECLHGVARTGYATVFPQSITVAASWDKELVYNVASVISDEARGKYQEFVRRGERDIFQGLTFWSPNVNIFRDPRWGRGQETYGEDPYLSGQMGKEFVLGLQGGDSDYLKVVATAKHFAVHSGPEKLRHSFDVDVSDRDLYETYLPAFKTLVEEGDVYSVMGAYNRFRGESCSANSDLFHILRDEWGFDGYIVSDCWAIRDIWQNHKIVSDAAEASALAVKVGCDLNCGTTYESLSEAVERGLITEDQINISVKRLFMARFKLGMFDPIERVEYAQIPYSVNCNATHDELAREAARESIILLKNENNTLPLLKKLKTIAVIGPNADNEQSLLGNYNGVPKNPVTVLQGIKNKIAPEVNVLYAQGSSLAKGIDEYKPIPSIYLETPDGEQGILGEYFNNNSLEGQPLYTQVDDKVDFLWDIDTPDPRLKTGHFSIRWTGYIVAPETGTYNISVWGQPNVKVIYKGEEVVSGGNRGNIYPIKINMGKGNRYKIDIEYKNTTGDATAKLIWSAPHDNMQEEAVHIAEKANAVVVVLGLNERLEGEQMQVDIEGFAFGDRTNLKLPIEQLNLLKAVYETGKPVILVLLNGGPIAINWAADHIPAILTAGYPGQQGGNAIADVLFGDYNPAGRLPVTYYKSVEQLPPFEDYDMEGRTYRYFKQEPLYPFGHGLSYSLFTYSNLQIPEKVKMDEPVTILVDVTNVGDRDGDEVVQLYITDEKASTPRPVRQLEGFKRIHLKKGETQKVQFTLKQDQLSMINKKNNWVVEPGWFTLCVGGKQPGFSGRTDANTTSTLTGRFQVTGETILID